MSSVNKLKIERAQAKSKVTRLVNILDPLLDKKGSEASDVQDEVTDHTAKLEDGLVQLKRAHKKFAECLENETDETQIDEVADANNKYLTEAEAPAYQTLRKIKIFKAEVAKFSKRKEIERNILPGLKETFTRSVEKFRLEVSRITSKLKEFDSKTISQLKGIPSIKYLDISGAKTDLEAAFSGLYDARADYSEALKSVDMDISEAASVIFPDGSFSMEQSTTDFMNWQEQAEIVLGVQRELLEELQQNKIQQNKPQASAQAPASGDREMIKLGKAENTVFSGEARDFATFKREFSQIVIPGRAAHDVGYRLKQAVPQKHRHLLDEFDLANHVGMMTKLETQFGTMRLVVMNVVAEIKKLKPPLDDKSLVEFVERIEKAERDLKTVNHLDQIANEVVIADLEEKLPEKVSGDWLDIVIEKKLENADSGTKYRALSEHLVKCKEKAEYQVSKSELAQSKAKTYVVTGTTLAASAISIVDQEEKPKHRENTLAPCLACSKDGDRSEATRHIMARCEIWKKLSYKDKIKLASCLKCPFGNKDNHKTAECKKRIACHNCKTFGKHHPYFCDKSSPGSSQATSLSTNSSSDVILKTMIVKGENMEDISIVEDNCSTDNYVAIHATERLKLKPIRDVVLQIEGINSVKQIDSSVYLVPIRRKDSKLEYIECYGLQRITEQCAPLDPDMYGNICKELGVDAGEVRRPENIDILLSSRSNHLMSDEVLSTSGGLKLYSGPLGKTISGNAEMFTSEHVKSYPARVIPIICSSVKKSFSKLTDKQILDHFKEESLNSTCEKCPEPRQMSIKEEKEYKKFKDNMYLDVEGTADDPGPYWRTKYPWVIPKTDLEDNYAAVHGVMLSTARKLNKNPDWRKIYEDQLKDLVIRKFAKEVSSQELEDWKQSGGKTYWISHLMALNPASKSTPIRTCFNSSQMYKGHSLNSSWMLGPDMTGDLCGILMRFREDIVGAQGDVAKMYYNVRVEEEEQYMQLFMWKFEGEEQIRYFRMTRLVMGNKPSANCSQIALRESSYINDNDQKFPDAAQALTQNSYVDNTFVTAPNHDKVEEKIKQVETVAGAGGFRYKPWVISGSASPDQMIISGETEDEKALGVMWRVKEDLFYVKVNISGKKKNVNISLNEILAEPNLKLTLRDALSLHAKAFDPLGMILPTKTIGMLLFRETIQNLSLKMKQCDDKSSSKLPWDKEIDGSLKERWLEYFSMLDALQDITFPRSIKPEAADPESLPSLITFSDGSETCYGSAAYVLWSLEDGSKESRLIMSKSKLAPLLAKGEVVKNELSGATYAVRLKTWIMKNTNLQYSEFIPFLDSRIVQDMIRKDSYLLNTFAGNRVKEIAAKSNVYEWKHVSSKNNWCADILTRGATPDKLGPGSEWQCGPEWLRGSRDQWPVTQVDLTKPDRDILKNFEKVSKSFKVISHSEQGELHYGPLQVDLSDKSIGELHNGPDSEQQGELLHGPLQVTLNAAAGELHPGPSHQHVPGDESHVLDILIDRSSSLEKIVNTTAFLLRLGGRIGKKIPENYKKMSLEAKYENNPISAIEHKIALLRLIEHEQKKVDMKKFSGFNLETKEIAVTESKSLKLTILKSRVKNFPIKYQSEDDFVYVLPVGKFAKKIVEKFHRKFHKDIDTICTHVRREFWIPSLRRIAAQIDRNCKFCLILRKKVVSQLMGDMPMFRSVPGKPFENVNLDLFGPLVIKDSVVKRGARVRKQVWGVLFVCCGTRAIYLDFAEDYGTDSVLHCLRRLMADKGNVSRIISDPGTQMKGAAKELKEVRQGWSEAELIRFGAQHGITWDFVMASSQHQNGSAEVMIKLCKGVMKALMSAIGTNVLFLNELLTVLKETANLCNERPIGLKPNQSTDPQFLSPNSLLLGRCSDRISSGPFQSKNSFQADPDSDRTRFLLVQKITTQFWRNWTKLFFPTLLKRQKWHHEARNVKIGDVCVVQDPNAFRGEWRLARVTDTFPDEHLRVRNVKLVSPPPRLDGSPEYKGVALSELDRHVKNLIVIVPIDEAEKDDDDNGIAGSEELSQPAPTEP